jgi:hypothetical protein
MVLALFSRMLTFHVRDEVTLTFAHFYKYLTIWFLTAGLSFYGPIAVYNWRTLPALVFWALWFFSIALGLTLHLHPDGLPAFQRRFRIILSSVTAYTFLTGLFLFVSWLISYVVLGIEWRQGPFPEALQKYWIDVDAASQPFLLVLFTGLMILLVVLSARFGINQSSMHLFYQGRLADAYLDEGLPGSERFPNSNRAHHHTKLNDLVSTCHSKYVGPYLLFNATMNLAKSSELAWQERRAANFLFSPLFSGYELPKRGRVPCISVFRRSSEFSYGGHDGISLAHAMAVSASALGSNMGMHTSPRVRFLHTVLNMRLGWWFANPNFPGSWGGDLLRSRVNLMWDEFMGHTDELGPFVHLSDGGHFENLGIYELVRRRCRLLIVSDATEDATESYRALGVAVQRCRTDLGVEISIDLSKLGDAATHVESQRSFFVGRISYRDVKPGVIIYVRARVNNGLPVDVKSFKNLNPDFPNEPTVNQWFQESQFEAYRCLGFALGREVGRALSPSASEDICDRAESIFIGDL